MNWNNFETEFGGWLVGKFNGIIDWVKGIRTDLQGQIDSKVDTTTYTAGLAQTLATAVATAESNLRAGVPVEGDTLKKLYGLIGLANNAIGGNSTSIANIEALLNSDTNALDTLQEVVDFIETNRDTLDNLTIGGVAGLQSALDALTAADTSMAASIAALEAVQGDYVKYNSGTVQEINSDVDFVGSITTESLLSGQQFETIVEIGNEYELAFSVGRGEELTTNFTIGDSLSITFNGNETIHEVTSVTAGKLRVLRNGSTGVNSNATLRKAIVSTATVRVNGSEVVTEAGLAASQALQDAALAAETAARTNEDANLQAQIDALGAADDGFVSITGAEDVTGAKNFTGGLNKSGEEVATQTEVADAMQSVMDYVDANMNAMN